MGTENWRCPNSRKKSSVESLLRLNRLDWAVVLAEHYGVDILSQHRRNYRSHFPLRAMQNDLVHVQELYNVNHFGPNSTADISNLHIFLHTSLNLK